MITSFNNIAWGEEVELLTGVLPSSYNIKAGDPSYATDRNTSTAINLYNGPGAYWVEYTLPLGTTVTAYEVVGVYRGIIKFLDEERNILWQKEFYNGISETSINVDNVRYVFVTSGERSGGNWFYLKELYIGGIVPTPPNAPQNLEAFALAPTRVKLTWEANSDLDLAGYVIYRSGEEIDRVNNDVTYYIDNSVSPGNTYTYSIKAYDTEGLYSDLSNLVEITTPLLPDLKAPALEGQILSPKAVKLMWNPVDGVDGYVIYKNDIEITRLDNTKTEFLNAVEPGNVYNYGIKSYIEIGGIEYASEINNTTVKVDPPNPVLTYSIKYNDIILNWSGYADLYKVYVDGELLATTTDKQYTFKGEEGKSYRMRVDAVYLYDNSVFPSNEVNIYVPKISLNTKMALDILRNIGNSVHPMGGLLALALALKASPWLIDLFRLLLGRRL